MDEHSKPRTILERLQALRVELKEWERAFTTNHEGQKAGHDDIKKDAVIGEIDFFLIIFGFRTYQECEREKEES